MNSISIPLYNKFYQIAQKDLEAARSLAQAGQYPQALYHLQQSYEKSVKSLYIYQETRHNNAPEADAGRNVKAQLGHDTEESTITVLRRMAEIDNRQFEDQLRNATDPKLVQLRQALKNGLDGYNRSLDRMVSICRIILKTTYEAMKILLELVTMNIKPISTERYQSSLIRGSYTSSWQWHLSIPAYIE